MRPGAEGQHVIDPMQGIDQRVDVAVADGKAAELGGACRGGADSRFVGVDPDACTNHPH